MMEDSLITFTNHINFLHRIIKFALESSSREAHFLDGTVCKDVDSITTDLFSKPTDTHHNTSTLQAATVAIARQG